MVASWPCTVLKLANLGLDIDVTHCTASCFSTDELSVCKVCCRSSLVPFVMFGTRKATILLDHGAEKKLQHAMQCANIESGCTFDNAADRHRLNELNIQNW